MVLSKLSLTSLKVIFLAFLLISVNYFSKAQSLFLFHVTQDTIPTILLPKISNDSLRAVFDNQNKNAPFVFAKNRNVSINTINAGKWFKSNDSTATWLCSIKSPDAFTLNFTLSHCSIPKGASLYFINQTKNIIVGPYTSKQINEDANLFVEPIPGDEITVEFDVPNKYPTDNSFFTIKTIGHDFRDFYKSTSPLKDLSASCEVDINCPKGAKWQIEKRAVVKIVFTDEYSGGTTICSGTLINNMLNNAIPYVLTATHCISDETTAKTASFYFDYENSQCGIANSSLPNNIVKGSDLVATSIQTDKIKLDFTLLKMKSPPPANFFPYFAGWTLSTTPPQSGVCIHHPKGDVKKISVDSNAVLNGSFTDDGFRADSHWNIVEWSVGATEPGSSGSPLFNQNHQLVGDLTGGDAICDSAYNDFFAKLYESWDTFPDSANQLKCWLDPSNKNIQSCAGLDPLLANGNPISNVNYGEQLCMYRFGSFAKGGWSGYNEPQFTYCADQFTNVTNGNIYAIKFPIKIFNKNANIESISLKVWTGTTAPDSLLFEQTLSKDSVIQNQYYFMRLAHQLNNGSNFFVGFDLSKLTINDSCFLYTVENRSTKSNTLFYYYQNKWVAASNLGLNSSLGIELYLSDSTVNPPIISQSPEKVVLLNSDSLLTLISKQLFDKDSLSNIVEKNALQVYSIPNNEGYWSGTTPFNFEQFAEKYTLSNNKFVRNIKLAVAKNLYNDTNTHYFLTVWKGQQTPDSLLYKQEISAGLLDSNYFNVVHLNQKIYLDSIGFIGLSSENTSNSSIFALYMGNSTDDSKKHSYFYNSNEWLNYSMYDINEALGISVGTCYSPYLFEPDTSNYKYPVPNYGKHAIVAEKDCFVYPNVTQTNQPIYINMGSNFEQSDVTVQCFDRLGRKLILPLLSQPNGFTLCVSTQGMVQGLYFARVFIKNQPFKAIPFIILN